MKDGDTLVQYKQDGDQIVMMFLTPRVILAVADEQKEKTEPPLERDTSKDREHPREKAKK